MTDPLRSCVRLAWLGLSLWGAAGCTFEVPSPYVDQAGGGAAGAAGGGGGGGGGPNGAGGHGGDPAPTGGAGGDGGSGGIACAPLAECPGEDGCFDTANDPTHCGALCKDCGVDALCDAGECTCPIGTESCSNPPGCYQTASDPDHCGDCQPCGPGEGCFNGVCDCEVGKVHCPGLLGCFDLLTDESHCGACPISCEAFEVCTSGSCGCAAGEQYCADNGPTPEGCYADTADNEDRCGASCQVCHATEQCTNGDCICPAATHACSSGAPAGCFADDDASHCGPSCLVCPSGQECNAGSCQCPAGSTQCGTECVADLTTDAEHCGSCNRACGTPRFPGASCVGSTCFPAQAVALPAHVGTAALDAADPTKLYLAGNPGSGPSGLYRVDLGDASSAVAGPPIDFINATLAAHAGQVAVTLETTDSPLWIGPFTGSLAEVDSNVPLGATFIRHLSSQNEFYWAELGGAGCLYRQGNLAGFGCGASARGMAQHGSKLYLVTPQAGNHVDELPLPDGPRAAVPVWEGSAYAAYGSPGIAVSPAGKVFYFSQSPQPTRVVRYDPSDQTSQNIRTFPGFVETIAIVAIGPEIYWITESGDNVSIEHAPAEGPFTPSSVSFAIPANSTLRSWLSDSVAFYFVAQRFSPSFESKLYRITR